MKNLIPFLIFSLFITLIGSKLNYNLNDYYFCFGGYALMSLLRKLDEIIKALKDNKN